MECLWLTLADPDPPKNGQFLYSSGLIKAIADAGASIEVLGFEVPGAQHRHGDRSGRIRWWLTEHAPRSNWSSLASPHPYIAGRTRTLAMREMLRRLLSDRVWDAIVFDSIVLGWALHEVLVRNPSRASRPRLVYLSHNHEENVARHLVWQERNVIRRAIKYIDAAKTRWLERSLCRCADLITSNSPQDAELFRRDWPNHSIEFLPPGYSGREVTTRSITDALPRRAIIVGSFDWIAKRTSLEDFLASAHDLFAAAGIELVVVGGAEASFLNYLRATYPAARFIGPVDDLDVHMSQARLALVPDYLGGFKLKALDYVFHRLPILAIAGSVPGMPLEQGKSVLLYPNHRALAEGVVRAIDDLPLLNGIQQRAYLASRGRFDWRTIGGTLLTAISRPMRKTGDSRLDVALPTAAG